MRVVVPGFEHRPGVHCGSTAMADALRTVGIDLSEELAFGLGAGAGFFYLSGFVPSHFFLGRSATYEQDLCARLSVPFDEAPVAEFDEAWRRMRAHVDAGRVVLFLADLRWFPHYRTRTHFNGHRVVLAGYDAAAEVALVADTDFPGLVEVPLPELQKAMTSAAPPVPSPECFFGVLAPPTQPLNLAAQGRAALRQAADSQLEAEGTFGLAGMELLVRELPAWGGAPDAARCARYSAGVIEKRGNGGGLFRRLYSRFLLELGQRTADPAVAALAPLSLGAADAWTALAEEFARLSEEPAPDFTRAAELARAVLQAERALWSACREVAAG